MVVAHLFGSRALEAYDAASLLGKAGGLVL
jgi:hypothetical protein